MVSDYFQNDGPPEVLRYRLKELERRLGDLEAEKGAHNLGVFETRLDILTDDVKALRRAFYTFAFAVVGSSVVFAFSVFALLGKP